MEDVEMKDETSKDKEEEKKEIKAKKWEHQKKNKYTIEEKLSIINQAKSESLHSLSNKYGIDRKTIRDWIKLEDTLKKQNDLHKFRIAGGGAKNDLCVEKEIELVQWILQNRKLDLPITTSVVISYLLKLEPKFKEKTNNALKIWCFRFLKKNNFVLRRASHIGQPLPSDYMNKITIFLKDIIDKRKILKIDNNNLQLIINVDETPIFFDAPFESTIDQKGVKQVNIKTSGYEKERISVILACAANGIKLAPLIIFKGQEGKRIEKELSAHKLVKNKRIYVKCQPNSWCTTDIFKFWIKEIFLKYECNNKSKCILVLDKAPSHFNDTIEEYMNNNTINYIYIPGGLTSKLQPLDISVNKSFKNAYKKKYTEYVITNSKDFFNGIEKPKREDILSWIEYIWYSDEILSKNVIINGFRKSGISLPLDGSEDNNFNFQLVHEDNSMIEEIIDDNNLLDL